MLKMWIAAVVVCGLLGFCLAAEYRPSYAQNVGKLHYPEPSYVLSAAYRQRVQADYDAAQVDDLLASIERILDRKRQLKERIGYLKDASSKNRAFQYKFETIVSKDINNEIQDQNVRLYDLAEKIATIQGLRRQVTQLQYLAQEVRNSTDRTVAADDESSRRVANSQTEDIAEEINKASQTALRVASGLQAVYERINNDSRLLTTAELEVKKIAARLEYSTAQTTEVTITLDSQGIGNATLSYPGFPEEYDGFRTGLHYIRRSGKYGAPNLKDAIDNEVVFASPGEGEIDVQAIGETPSAYVNLQVMAYNFIGSKVD